MFFKVLIQYLESLRLSDLIIVITALYIIYKNNIQMIKLEDIVLGRTKKSPLVLSFYKTIIGLTGGLFVSYLINIKGINFNSYIEIQAILFLTVLSFIRFFSLIDISITSLAIIIYSLNFNSNSLVTADIIGLYYLLSFLLIVEGLIMSFDPKIFSVPIFKKIDNDIYGGYKIKDFYFVILFLSFIPGSNTYLIGTLFLLSIMFFGVNESVFTFSKKIAMRVKGSLRVATGIITYILTEILASRGNSILILILIFPLLLKGEKYLFREIEKRRKPKFLSNKKYKTILDVRKNSYAYASGLRAGDKIIQLNGEKEPSYTSIIKAVQGLNKNKDVNLTIVNKFNLKKVVNVKIDSKESSGIIIVPAKDEITIK